ncbi:MAG: carboxymuconolactone decarboxylase family protein [Lysobacterales bacterium]
MFTYHTKDTAPAEAHNIIDRSQKIFGTVPNLHRILAEAPVTYDLYNYAFAQFRTSSLTSTEQQIVMMAANYENRCHYCTAGHSMMMKAEGISASVIEALREGLPLEDPKQQALRVFVQDLIAKRGHVGDAALQQFLDAGFDQRQVLEVLTGLAAKLISNYTNALAKTDLDPMIQSFAWSHPEER